MRQVSGQIIKCVILVVLAVAGLALLATCAEPAAIQQGGKAENSGFSADDGEACTAENIEDTLLTFHNLTREFDQVLFIAQNTPPSQLVSPLMKMQEVRHAAEQQEALQCMQVLKANRDNYMNATIIYMSHFMSGQEDSIQAEMTAAAQYQNDYKAELTRLLVEYNLEPVSQSPTASPQDMPQEDAGLPAEQLPENSDEQPEAHTEEQPADGGGDIVQAGNGSENPVMLRSMPDGEAEVVGQLEPFTAISVMGISENQIWFLVEYADAPAGVAWLDSRMVEVSGPVESLLLVSNE